MTHVVDISPVKLIMSDSKRRTRLNLPLRLSQFSSQLCQKVRSIFPEIQDSNLYYVDGEGESIIVDADANLVEARDLFKGIGRVPSFVVKKAAPPPQSSSKPRSKQVFRSIAHVRSVTTVYEFPVGKICGNRTIAKPSTAMIIIAMIAIFVTACVTESFGTQCRQSVDWLIRPAPESEFATPGRIYTIQSKSAHGKFLNVDRASYDNGAKLHLWDNPQKPETQWYIKLVAPHIYNIINVKSGKAVNIAFAGKHNGAVIQQWDNFENPETRFKIHAVGDAYTIQTVHSNKYINVAGGATSNGAKVIQWDNPGAHETQWFIRSVAA